MSFVNGLTPAVWVGAALVGVAALAALAIPRQRKPRSAEAGAEELVPELEAAA